MERKNFAGWLFISLLPLFAFIWTALMQPHASAMRVPIAAEQVSAELARAVSYGFVEQPVDEALGMEKSDVVAPHKAAVMPRHTVFQPASESRVGASALKSS